MFMTRLCVVVFFITAIFLSHPDNLIAKDELKAYSYESFRGVDKRRKQVRKADDPWFGLNPQTRCPITGRRLKINKKTAYEDYHGHRIYLSSKRIKWIFKKFPNRSIRKMYDWGERPMTLAGSDDSSIPVPAAPHRSRR